MQTLERAARRRGTLGDPLPNLWAGMVGAGMIVRQGQLVMCAAAPNVGKSAWALMLAVRSGLPTLYFSADTDAWTTVLRTAAHLCAHDMAHVEQRLRTEPDHYRGILRRKASHIKFCWDSSPSLDDIADELHAYQEIHGQDPALIIIDNLLNVQCGDADEYRGMRIIVQELHTLARQSGACVVVLHHVTGEFDVHEGTCPPRRALHGKVSQLPELILTLGRHHDHLGIACVKNRTGKADPTGGSPVWLQFNPERMQLDEGSPV